jgi:membrane-bound lytic murein transglycosylase B
LKRIFVIAFFLLSFLDAKDYREEAKPFIEMMVQRHQYDRSTLEKLFSDVSEQEKVLARYRPKKSSTTLKRAKRTPLKGGPWDRYAKYKVNEHRITEGKKYLKKYKTAFKIAQEKYGVPKEYIAAIIGVESAFGRNVGKHPVFDTLATLGIKKNRRQRFFKQELEKFLVLVRQNSLNPKSIKGSYTGAIGLGQFMPSNYAYYGVDMNHDGKVSLQNPVDAIGSIANYLKKNGWKKGELIATRVSYAGMRFRKHKTGYKTRYDRSKLKGIKPKAPWNYHDKVSLIKLKREKFDELWYGAKNFYVITRYNHSAYYAMSIHQLAQGIASR